MKKLVTALSGVFLATALQAAVFTFQPLILSGANEVPPNASTALGTGTVFSYDTSTKALILTGTFTGLAGPATAAHVHTAPAGVNGPVLFPVSFTPGTSGAFVGASILSPASEVDLLNGGLYVNIHDAVYPGGEIRAQIIPVPEPAQAALLAGTGLLGLAAFRRYRSRN